MRFDFTRRFIAIMLMVIIVPTWIVTSDVAAQGSGTENDVAIDEEFKPRNIFVAFGLSAIIPSAGQFYNGEYRKGGLMAALIVSSFVMAYGFDEDADILSGPGSVLFWTTYAWSVWDAPASARRINGEHLSTQSETAPAPAGTGDGAGGNSSAFAPMIGIGRDSMALGVSWRF